MTGKVMLGVQLPSGTGRFEVRVPLDMTVDEAASLISQLLSSQMHGLYEPRSDAGLMVCDAGRAMPGEQLNPNETLFALVEQGVLVEGSWVAIV
jgi:hypothetical protein